MNSKNEMPLLYPNLDSHELHIWMAGLNDHTKDIDRFRSFLSPDELSRAKRFKIKEFRECFIIARGILKDILSRYLQIKPDQVHLAYEKLGKPYLETSLQQRVPGLSFNLSHSRGFAIYGISKNQSIGIDLEYQEKIRTFDDIAGRFFSQSEIQEIEQAEGEIKKITFYNIWTKKEALLKALGLGLHLPLSQFTVTGGTDHPDILSDLSFDPDAKKWVLFSLNSDVLPFFSISIALNDLPKKCPFLKWYE